jgi:hypothetical protein
LISARLATSLTLSPVYSRADCSYPVSDAVQRGWKSERPPRGLTKAFARNFTTNGNTLRVRRTILLQSDWMRTVASHGETRDIREPAAFEAVAAWHFGEEPAMEICDDRWAKCSAPRRNAGARGDLDPSDLEDCSGPGWRSAGLAETGSPPPP